MRERERERERERDLVGHNWASGDVISHEQGCLFKKRPNKCSLS